MKQHSNTWVWVVLLLVMLTPLPFGMNRAWAWLPLALGISLLFSYWAWRPMFPPLNRWHYTAIIAWLITCTAALLQSILPWDWPIWDATATTLTTDIAGTWSLNPAATLAHIPRLLTYGMLAWIGFCIGQNPQAAKRCWWGLWIAGIAYASYGIIQYALALEYVLHLPKQLYCGSKYLASTPTQQPCLPPLAPLGLNWWRTYQH